jgi:hypothetical protein
MPVLWFALGSPAVTGDDYSFKYRHLSVEGAPYKSLGQRPRERTGSQQGGLKARIIRSLPTSYVGARSHSDAR